MTCHAAAATAAAAAKYSVLPHRWQPTRLPLPWDSSGKNTGVGCHFLLQCMKVKSESEFAQSCRTLSDPMDCSLPGSSIHGIFQARVLEWGAIAFSILRYVSLFLYTYSSLQLNCLFIGLWTDLGSSTSSLYLWNYFKKYWASVVCLIYQVLCLPWFHPHPATGLSGCLFDYLFFKSVSYWLNCVFSEFIYCILYPKL